MERETKIKNLSRICLLLAALIWGSTFFILKNTLDELPSAFVMAVRFSFGALLLAIVFAPRLKHFNKSYILGGLLVGGVGGFAAISQTIGLSMTTPGKNAFLTAVYCVMVPFLFWITAKKRPTVYNVISALICVAGIGCVTLNEQLTFNLGDGLTLLSGFFYAVQIVVMKKHGDGKDVFVFTMVQFVATALVCWIYFAAFETMPTSIGTSSWLSLAYLTVFGTVTTFSCMNYGVKNLPPASSSLLMSLESVFGVAFSMLFYHEVLTLQIGLGFAFIFVAVVISETELKFFKRKNKVD